MTLDIRNIKILPTLISREKVLFWIICESVRSNTTVYSSQTKTPKVPHCYLTRLNLRKMGPLQFCLRVFLGVHRNPKQKKILIPVRDFWNKPIYPLGRSPRQILDNITEWHFHSTSNQGIWPKKNSNFVERLKSDILAFF